MARWRLVPAARGARGTRRGARRLIRDVIVDRVAGRFEARRFGAPRGHVRVFAPTLDALADLADLSTGDADRLTLTVAWWVAPAAGWTGRLPAVSNLLGHRIRLPRSGRGRATVDVRLERPVPVGPVLEAARSALRPFHPLPARRAARVDEGSAILIDESRFNPRGRRPESYQDSAPAFVLTAGRAGRVRGPRAAPPWGWPGGGWRCLASGELSWSAVTALRSVGSVTHVPSGADARAEAELLIQLAATGVLVYAPAAAVATGELIAPGLRGILAEPLPQGDLERELRSVRQRCTALREHSVRFGRWRPPPVSVLLATRRPEYLEAALRMIAAQTYPNLEIVLCLHGIDAPDATLIGSLGRPVEVVRVRGDLPFGAALDTAAARASGDLLSKMDDDDTYGADHIWDLVLARAYSGATLVGKGIEFVYLQGQDVTVRRRSGQPESDTTTVAGGTLLIGRVDLAEVGGWPHASQHEDRALLDRLLAAGAVIYRTHPLGYLYHRRAAATGEAHAWAAEDEFFLRGASRRWAGPLDLVGLSGRAPGAPPAG